MQAKEIINYLNKIAPPALADSWDNVGFLIGSKEKEIKKVLVCLDITSKVVEEAITKNIDMIVAHHPIIFKGLKRVTEDNQQSKLVYRLIKNDINVYAAHTNLDIAPRNINTKLCELLGLKDCKNLISYKKEKLFKLAVFVPKEAAEKIRNAICGAGAGWIGKYKDCTFQNQGTGTFTPLEGTDPYIGRKNELAQVEEVKIETVVPEAILDNVIQEMLANHPYEEVAYDIYELKNDGIDYGLGKIGVLNKSYEFSEFADYIKECLKLSEIRYIGNKPDKINKVAVFCGSYDDEFLPPILKSGADILITGDLKHHDSIDMSEAGLCAIDCTHYGTEHVVVELFKDLLYEKFREIEIVEALNEANPLTTI